ncbi:MAG: helix-turn-helix domain-containing protein [Pseudomonadota bacterium]
MAKQVLSLEEARARLRRAGISARALARELGVHQSTVSEVLRGRHKGVRGDAHKVAVALGIKEGVIVDSDQTITEALKKA